MTTDGAIYLSTCEGRYHDESWTIESISRKGDSDTPRKRAKTDDHLREMKSKYDIPRRVSERIPQKSRRCEAPL